MLPAVSARPVTFADPQQVLESVFGYREFRPGQRKIIETVLSGRDCIGVMPTGAGKSITFQIPAKILPGTVLVISPLIALMKDQVDGLERLGFQAAVINSTLDREERARRLAALRAGAYELVYVAPEALGGSLRGFIASCSISLVVVDEAHCISHWGHDFRPAYRQLQGLKAELGDLPVLALTATATRRVAADIIRQLGMRRPDGYKGSFFRPNLRVTAQKKGGGRNSRRDLLSLVRRYAGQSGIVYCASRKSVDSLAAWLQQQGVSALPYHAGLTDEERTRHQDAFARGEVSVIVATVAFGMGINKSDIRFVVHRDMPRSIEAWYQEMGRAGRDGLTSDCVVMYSWADVVGYDAFLEQVEDPALRAETRARTVDLFRLLDRGGCRHQAVVRYFDEQIEPCGDACDVCRGTTLADLGVPTVVRRAGRRATTLDVAPEDVALFERLRALRRRLAEADDVPAYVVFNDATLHHLARTVPRTRAALLAVPGVGPAKLERYGHAFLQVLREEEEGEEEGDWGSGYPSSGSS